MSEKRGEIQSIPNDITAMRLATLPLVYRMARDEPGKKWPVIGVLALSDNLDGFLARLGDKHPLLHRLGFKRTELGRKLDPLTDKLFTGTVLLGAMEGGSIPSWLGKTSIAQKLVTSAVSLDAENRKKEVHVSKTGKVGEFATNFGFGFMLASESVDNPTLRNVSKVATGTVAVAGMALSAVATVGYARQSGRLPEEPSELEQAIEAFADKISTLPFGEKPVNEL